MDIRERVLMIIMLTDWVDQYACNIEYDNNDYYDEKQLHTLEILHMINTLDYSVSSQAIIIVL